MILKYWPIITTVLASTLAFGVSFQKIENLEQAVVVQTVQAEKISDLKAKQERIDERTQIMLDLLQEIKQDVKREN